MWNFPILHIQKRVNPPYLDKKATCQCMSMSILNKEQKEIIEEKFQTINETYLIITHLHLSRINKNTIEIRANRKQNLETNLIFFNLSCEVKIHYSNFVKKE